MVIAGLGYLAWDVYQTYKEETKKEKEKEKKNFWGMLKEALGGPFYKLVGKTVDGAGGVLDNIVDVTTIFKWVLVGGSVLIGLALIVFIGRMEMGNTPDPTQAISRMAQLWNLFLFLKLKRLKWQEISGE